MKIHVLPKKVLPHPLKCKSLTSRSKDSEPKYFLKAVIKVLKIHKLVLFSSSSQLLRCVEAIREQLLIHLSPAEHVNTSELQLRAQGAKVVHLERHSNETMSTWEEGLRRRYRGWEKGRQKEREISCSPNLSISLLHNPLLPPSFCFIFFLWEESLSVSWSGSDSL